MSVAAKRQQREGRRKARNTQTKPQTQPPSKNTRPQRKTVPGTNKGRKNTPKIKQMYRNDGLCAQEANRKHIGIKAKRKTTGRSQENSGRKRKGVRVSAYLFPDRCSVDKNTQYITRRQTQSSECNWHTLCPNHSMARSRCPGGRHREANRYRPPAERHHIARSDFLRSRSQLRSRDPVH